MKQEGNLLKDERHAFILKQVNLFNKVLSTDLAAQLQVSDDTIRRDLAELAETGAIIKVHGGALSKSYHYSNQQNNIYAATQKKEIARKAISLLRNGMTVLTEAGTTMLEMVRAIPNDLEATFYTVSPLMALELAEHPKLNVILLGGQLDNAAQICIGEKLISDLADIQVDICFLGANAIDAKTGITEQDWRIVHTKKAMIRSASKLAILTISEKLNTAHKLRLCPPRDIDYLVTELRPGDKKLASYRKHMELM